MRTHAQAVVIGGGVIGCSILYHLTKLGWTDVVLLERDELTSGSTWHAAANIHGLHDNNNITRIQNYTYKMRWRLRRVKAAVCFNPVLCIWPKQRPASTSCVCKRPRRSIMGCRFAK